MRSFPERAVRVRALAGDIVLCSWTRHSTLTVPLSTHEWWVPANCWGNVKNCGEVTFDGLASRPGGVEIVLAKLLQNTQVREVWNWSIVFHVIIYYDLTRRTLIIYFIIHQTHYEKSDWSRAFNQFTIACELDITNAISAADIAFIMSSSTSAWLLSLLECSPKKQNGWTLRFCFWGWIMWKMCNKTIIEFGFRMISWIIKTSCLCYLPQPSASADNTDLGFDNWSCSTSSNNCLMS